MDAFTLFVIAAAVLAAIPLLWLLLSFKLGFKYRKSLFGKRRIRERSRIIPLNGSLAAIYYIQANAHRLAGRDYAGNIVASCMVRWILGGKVKLLCDPQRPQQMDLPFPSEFPFDEPLEKDVCKIVRDACGENGILEYGELDEWATKCYKKMKRLPEHTLTLGRRWFSSHHYLKKELVLTDEGKAEARHVIELQNYLDDVIAGTERTIDGMRLKDYLCFAALCGKARQLADALARYAAEAYGDLASSLGMDAAGLTAAIRYVVRISASARDYAEKEETRLED